MVLLGLPAQAAGNLTEDFSGPALGPGLEFSAPDSYSFSTGFASPEGDSRQYIRTVATDFGAGDFVLSLTFRVASGDGGAGTAFIGLGTGSPDSDYYDEPLNSVYFRSAPADFGDGFLQLSINSGAGNVAELTTLGNPGDGTHRALLTKVGDTLTFSLDANSSSGPFVADDTITLNLADERFAFLDNTNSRLFFGGQGTTVGFDQASISYSVPEPGSAAMFVGAVTLGFACWRRRRG